MLFEVDDVELFSSRRQVDGRTDAKVGASPGWSLLVEDIIIAQRDF
jgi:hypothetical protein